MKDKRGAPLWIKILLGVVLVLYAALAVDVLAYTSGTGARKTEDQIVDFMRDVIVSQGIGAMTEYIETSGQPWVEAAPEASIIVYGPISKTTYGDYQVDSDHAARVWWLQGNELTEVAATDRAAAIARYEEIYIKPAFEDSGIFTWSAHDFGILEIGPGGLVARVYTSSYCGSLCGAGFTFDLVRLPFGKWIIVREEMLWIS